MSPTVMIILGLLIGVILVNTTITIVIVNSLRAKVEESEEKRKTHLLISYRDLESLETLSEGITEELSAISKDSEYRSVRQSATRIKNVTEEIRKQNR